jgi:hypothetical protein
MPSEPIQNGSGPENVEALKQENANLREALARAKFEADLYRSEIYRRFNEQNPYVPLTPEQIHEMIHGPRGRHPMQVLEDFEKLLDWGE